MMDPSEAGSPLSPHRGFVGGEAEDGDGVMVGAGRFLSDQLTAFRTGKGKGKTQLESPARGEDYCRAMDDSTSAVNIVTVPGGYNGGRIYCLRVLNQEHSDRWGARANQRALLSVTNRASACSTMSTATGG